MGSLGTFTQLRRNDLVLRPATEPVIVNAPVMEEHHEANQVSPIRSPILSESDDDSSDQVEIMQDSTFGPE